MKLPAADLGIMAEHLATHEGMINKFKLYYQKVQNPTLKALIDIQIKVLRLHVQTMLAFIDPNKKGPIHLHNIFNDYQFTGLQNNISEEEKDILLEARATAKLMAMNNFNSALMMKEQNVSHVHIEMAMQERYMQHFYNEMIKQIDGDYTPKSSIEMQYLTLQKYAHVLHE